jgi:hypothetical protein
MSTLSRFLTVFLWLGLALGPRWAEAQSLAEVLKKEFADWETEAKAAGLSPAMMAEVLKLRQYDVAKDAATIWDLAQQLRKTYPEKEGLRQLLVQVEAKVPSAGGATGGTTRQQIAAELQNSLLRQLDDSLKQTWAGQSPKFDQLASKINAAWEDKIQQQRATERALKSAEMNLIYGTIAASLLALLGYWLGSRRQPKPKAPDPELVVQLQRQKDLTQRFQAENSQLAVAKQQLEAQLAEQKARLEARIAALERPVGPEPDKTPPIVKPGDQVGVAPAIFYAKFADREQPLGFTLRNLSQQVDEEKVFVIEVLSATEAEYRILESYEAFVKANQIMAYFKEACSFDQSPTTANQRIETLVPGKLAKDRDSWQIVDKAKVRFV